MSFPCFRDPVRLASWAILAVSFLLRAFLAWRGGQLFWPDEDRFELSRRIAGLLGDGRFVEAAGRLLGQPDHLLFKAAGLIPAGLERWLGTPGWVSALFFAATSTWVLWLVQRVARAAGASATEGLVALLLAASTTSLFYYSRHFFPYDLSLGLFLLCLLRGLREGGSAGNSLQTGLWASLGFLAYNGYWSLGAVLLAVHVVRAWRTPRAMATRFTYALLGLALPLFVLAAISRLLGHDFFALTLSFAGTANQGELDHAWLFTLEYLWTTEHGLALLWGAALLLVLDRHGHPFDARVLLWPGLLLVLATLLILPPTLVHHFAVTARHIRVLTPFFCLAAAAALCRHPFWIGHPRRLALLLGAVIVQAAFNFAPPLAQVFPREYEQLAIRFLAGARQTDLGPYKIVNASFLHNPNWAPAGPDPGAVLLRRRHPFQFAPYLFEGYSQLLREMYLERDLSMRIVRLDAGGLPLRGYPQGMLEMILRFPPRPESLLPEPLLSTGAPGLGDTLFIRYDGPDHFVLGHDHIGGGAVLTPRLPLDRQRPHRLLIGMDAFFPPGALDRPPHRFLLWDDRILLDGRADQHPTTPDQITIGHNFIGASTAVTQLSAEILGFRRVPVPERGAVFPQPPGPLRLELLRITAPEPGLAEPLFSSGPPGRGDVVFLRNEGDGRFRVGHDHWGRGALLSEPLAYDPSRRIEFIVALAPFLPAPGAPDATGSSFGRLYVSCNGVVIFNRFSRFYPAQASDLVLGRNHAASTAVVPELVSELLTCEPVPAGTLRFPGGALPGPLRLKFRFSTPAPRGVSVPLVSTGVAGAGDLLFIRFDAQGNYEIGHDHWGHPAATSASRPFDPTRPLELTVSLGSLLPSGTDAGAPADRLRDRLFVAVGDDTLLDQPARFHPAAGSWTVGLNAIGASSAAEILPADLLDFSPVSSESIPPSSTAP